METKINGLPRWVAQAGIAVQNGNIHSWRVLNYFQKELSPNNVRALWSARAEARIEQHHNNALQIALVECGGSMNDFARVAVKWTAIKDAAEAEKENFRIGKRLHDVGLLMHDNAALQRRALIAALVRMGLASDDEGEPVPGLEERRANGLRQSYMHAYYEETEEDEQSLARLLSRAAKPASKKEERKPDATDDLLMSWMGEEEPGKTIPVEDPPAISRCVVIHATPAKTATKSGASDEESRIKMRNTLAEKKQIGPALDRHRIDEIYAQLFEESPWHAGVIEWLWRRHLETLDDPERCAWLPPSLIIGPPGCGKTYLLTRLTEILGLPAVRMDMTGSLEPWPIAGGAWGWRNAQPGLAVKTVLESGFANPFLLLDEVEKAGQSQHGGPLNALLPLLQRETARSYRCPYLEAEIDLSRVSWVMLGNDLTPLSGPLRDRVTIMTARGPEGSEIHGLAERLLGPLVADERVIDAAVAAMEGKKMSLRGLHRLAREFRALLDRPQLN